MRQWYAIFDRDLLSWRTRTCSLFGGSTSYSGTWPSSGTMRSGRASERVTWVPRIDDGAALSLRGWPTPTASDYKGSIGKGSRRGSTAEAVHPMTSEGRTGTTMYPHPAFVEWLMGFPPGWVTDLCPELSAGQNSDPTGGPSCER